VPIGGGNAFLISKFPEAGNVVDPGRDTIRKQYHAGIVLELILHKFHVLGHHRTDTAAAGKYEVSYVDFSFYYLLSYRFSVLIRQRKWGNSMTYLAFDILFGGEEQGGEVRSIVVG
jgi:hypothetical protein